MKIIYKEIGINQTNKISEIDASQFIKRAWRMINQKLELIDLNYQSAGFPEGYQKHHEALKDTINHHGYAIGAFYDEQLIGFVTVNRELFGNKHKYVLLDQLFISLLYRQKGIGKKLFSYCVIKARSWKADKLYICAGSAEDTIAFYKKLGCERAMEINLKLYESDPRDIQMEFEL